MKLSGHTATGMLGLGGWILMAAQGWIPTGWSGAGAVCLMIGALAPDWDHGSSWISRCVPVVHLLYRWIGSNPLTWALAAPRGIYPRHRPLNVDWLWKSVDNFLGRKIWGDREAEARAYRWCKGRKKIRSMLGHRKAMHSWLGALWSIMFWWGGSVMLITFLATSREAWAYLAVDRWRHAGILAAGFGIGYVIHLASDMLTIQGIPLWWPLSQKRVWLVGQRFRIRSEDA